MRFSNPTPKTFLLTAAGKETRLQPGHELMFDDECRVKIFSQMPKDDQDPRFQLLPRGFRTQSEGYLLHPLQTLGLKRDEETRRLMMSACFSVIEMSGLQIDTQSIGGELQQSTYVRLKERINLPEIYLKVDKVSGDLVFSDKNLLEEEETEGANRAPVKAPFDKVPISADQLTMWVDQVKDLLLLAGRKAVTCIGDSPVDATFSIS